MESTKELKQSYEGRKTRINILSEQIKSAGKLPLEEVYKFALNRWMISARVVTSYIKDLTATGKFKIESTIKGDYIVYVGE